MENFELATLCTVAGFGAGFLLMVCLCGGLPVKS